MSNTTRRRRVAINIPGQVTEVTLGQRRHLNPGTEFSVRGHRGRLRFTDARLAEDGTVLWVTGVDADRSFRSFHPDRVRAIHRTERLRGRA